MARSFQTNNRPLAFSSFAYQFLLLLAFAADIISQLFSGNSRCIHNFSELFLLFFQFLIRSRRTLLKSSSKASAPSFLMGIAFSKPVRCVLKADLFQALFVDFTQDFSFLSHCVFDLLFLAKRFRRSLSTTRRSFCRF